MKNFLFCSFVVFSVLTLSGCFEGQSYAPEVVVDDRAQYRPNMYKTHPGRKISKPLVFQSDDRSSYQLDCDNCLSGRTIVVDPGHGGKDPGAGLKIGFSSKPEKEIVLDIALELAADLRKCGAKVIMTRRDDRFIELVDRARIADKYHADLFVSVHADSIPHNPSIKGPTVYIARKSSKKSRIAALKINAALRRWGLKPRGVRRANYKVLVSHLRPAVLVECGYLTNRQEARWLNSKWYRKKVAKALAEGICSTGIKRKKY